MFGPHPCLPVPSGATAVSLPSAGTDCTTFGRMSGHGGQDDHRAAAIDVYPIFRAVHPSAGNRVESNTTAKLPAEGLSRRTETSILPDDGKVLPTSRDSRCPISIGRLFGELTRNGTASDASPSESVELSARACRAGVTWTLPNVQAFHTAVL